MDEDDAIKPRVIASGPDWREFDDGTTEYDPPNFGLPADSEGPAPGPGLDYRLRPDHERGSGYNIRPAVTWEAARRDYLAGDSATDVCARYGLRLGTLRHRAASDGWRRADAPEPEPVDWAALAAELGPPDLGTMTRDVLLRLRVAILAGRAAEAASWLRVHARLVAVGAGPDSDDSDHSDPVFSAPGDPGFPDPVARASLDP